MSSLSTEKRKLIRICRLIYDRHLSDSTGGNVSMLAGNVVLLTPKGAGNKRQWELEEDDVVVVSLDGNQLEGNGEPSRELRMHLGLYRNLPDAGAVIHAHPRYTMVYASACKPIPPTSDLTSWMGEIGLIAQAEPTSMELAENAIAYFKPLEAGLQSHGLAEESHGLAGLIPRHGMMTVGTSLEEAYDVLERVEGSAIISLFSKLLDL